MTELRGLRVDNSSIRGVVGQTLTPPLVAAFAAAFGSYVGRGRVLVGTDTRPSRVLLTLATTAGLLSVGVQPVDLGICPTPTLQQAILHLRAQGGIGITASNASSAFNALRFYGADGRVLGPNQFHELVDIYHQGVYSRATTQEIRQVDHYGSAYRVHANRILDYVDRECLRARKLKVLVDCKNGATSATMPRFLTELGCEVEALNVAEEAGPLASLRLSDRVRASRDAIGLTLDADGDKLSLTDEEGTCLDEDCTVAFAILSVLGREPCPVVVSRPTSRLVDDIARLHGARVVRSPVGETHVIDAMLETRARVGGEGNGGVIVPELNPCRDGFVAAALILELLARQGVTLRQLRGRFPRYYLAKYDLPCRPRRLETALRRLRHLYAAKAVDSADGVHISFDDAWLHVRGANTEPVVRIIAESSIDTRARDLVRQVVENLRTAVQ